MAESLRRLAVLGSPIAHSRSPALHAAAYEVLGLPWSYERIEIGEEQLAEFLETAGNEWRGLSLTMPLKERAFELSDPLDPPATLTQAVNTILFSADDDFAHDDSGQSSRKRRLPGFNTDVAGITRALTNAGLDRLTNVAFVGAGATAHSALVAVAQLGARRVTAIARSAQRTASLIALGDRLGVDVEFRDALEQYDLGQKGDAQSHDRPGEAPPELLVSTLPGGARLAWSFPEVIREHTVLLDVAYDPWPSELAASWSDAGGTVVSGLEMLLHQALVQVRIFVSGNPQLALPGEAGILKAMRAAMNAG